MLRSAAVVVATDPDSLEDFLPFAVRGSLDGGGSLASFPGPPTSKTGAW